MPKEQARPTAEPASAGQSASQPNSLVRRLEAFAADERVPLAMASTALWLVEVRQTAAEHLAGLVRHLDDIQDGQRFREMEEAMIARYGHPADLPPGKPAVSFGMIGGLVSYWLERGADPGN